MTGIKNIRRGAMALLLTMIMCFAFAMSASAAYWGSNTIGMGTYKTYYASSIEGGYYSIAANTTVTQTINFSNTATSSVKAGYYKSYVTTPSYQSMLSGTGSKKMSGSYTSPLDGKYKFYVYNGSSSIMNMTSMTATW